MNFFGSLRYFDGSTALSPFAVYSYTAGGGRNLSGKTSSQFVAKGFWLPPYAYACVQEYSISEYFEGYFLPEKAHASRKHE